MSENRIVAANFAGNKPEEQAPVRLNVKVATEIGGALERWKYLRAQAIQTPTSEAEQKGLLEYLANNLLTYAPELMGCWFVVRQEYEPMVNNIVAFVARVQEVNARRAEAHQARCDKQCSSDVCDNTGCCKENPKA